MLIAAKEEKFSAPMVWTDESVLPLAASGVYPKTRVWGSNGKMLHSLSATARLRIELRRGCEESSGKTAVGSGVSFKYDPLGRRIYKSSSAGTSIYAYDGDNLVEETNASGTAVARYSQGLNIDEPLAQSRSGATSYYEQDGLGSVTSLSNGAGALAQTYTFDSFGKQTAWSGSLVNPFQYTGRDYDPETGLRYYRARYYDSNIGRFLSEDPWDADPTYDESNLYVYVGNNPTNFIDPLGLYTLKHGVPAPSPRLDKLLKCMDGCVGAPIVVTGTTPLPGEKHQDPGHAAGTSVDIRPPAGIPASKVFCCAGQCGAAWGINEGSGGQRTPDTTAANYHFQLFPPHHPSPKAPNAIPPGCGPGGCSAPK